MSWNIATPLGWEASQSRDSSQHFISFQQFTGSHLNSRVERERGSLSVQCRAQSHNIMTQPGPESKTFVKKTFSLIYALPTVSPTNKTKEVIDFFMKSVSLI